MNANKNKKFIFKEFAKLFVAKNILVFSFIFLSLLLAFTSGFFSRDTYLEKNAEYISKVVLDNVPTKDLLSVAAERTDDGSLPDDESEFRQLYGVFRQEKITFAAGYNMTKENTILLDELKNENNMSAVYIGSTTGSTEYKGHYKDVTYPVELMFPLKRYDYVSMQTAIISESQAKELLAIRRPDFKKQNNTYTEEQFESLVGEPLSITINSEKWVFVIQDIFYENTYYSEGLSHTIGEFFYTSYYFPKLVKKQNLYFMCAYSYENLFFMKYIKSVYAEGCYDLQCVKNVLQMDIDDNLILNFFNDDYNSKQLWQWMFIALSTIFIILSLFLVIKRKQKINIFFIITYFSISFIPYLFFLVIHSITHDVLFFSGSSCKLYALFQTINISFCLIYYALQKIGLVKNNDSKDDYAHYELDI